MSRDAEKTELIEPQGRSVREARVVDMMLSMHSRLRDRYRRCAVILDLLLFAGSVVLCATVLLDPQVAKLARLTPESVRLSRAAVSILMFFLSLTSLRVDWKGTAGKHERACAALTDLKARCRAVTWNASEPGSEVEFRRTYEFVMASLEPIPDRQFAALKAYHVRKVAVSKLINANPGVPVWMLRLRLMRGRSGFFASGGKK